MAKKSTSSRPADTARKIWLAGLGAYGRAFSEAQESIARVTGDTSKVFDELVEKGERIEKTVETKGRELATRVAPAGLNIDDRIQKMRARLGMTADTSDAGSEGVAERLSAIEGKLDLILSKLDAAPQPTRKRKSVKKKA